MAISLLNAGPATIVAEPSDLPYALVEPGEWEFSGDLSGFTDLSVYYDSEEGEWFLNYERYGFPGQSDGVLGDGNELTVTFSHQGEDWHITATRASLPGHLLDRAVNRVVVTGATTLTLPALVHAGKARDFLVKVTTSADDLNITWRGQGSEAPNGADELQFVTEDGDFPVVGEAGTYLFSFTEVDAHTFAVSMKALVAAPQAQGGS